MQRTLVLALVLAPHADIVANDGAYLTRGGIIYPMKETRISLTKEHLSFSCAGDRATVEVLFEFNNPDTAARTLLVGFQAPTSVGDVSDQLILASRIRDMRVMVDGAILPVTVKAAECEDCPLMDVSSRAFHGDDPGIHVHLFEVTFKPGMTRVQHSYSFQASSHVGFDRIFNYILTTGSKWAGGIIADLTVEIDMGTNQYFYVADVFGPKADWAIVGTGAVTARTFDLGEGILCRMVRTVSGKLVVHARDLKPAYNIEFGVCRSGSFFGVPLEGASGLGEQVHLALRYGTLDMSDLRVAPLSKEDLRMLRNTIYAMHGHQFQDKELRAFFRRFDWYLPDPTLDPGDLELTPDERRLLDGIVKLEKNAP